MLKQVKFVVSVQAFTNARSSGSYGTSRNGVNECIAEGLNHARFLLAPIAGRMHTHAVVRVEVLCATCHGEGSIPGSTKRGAKRCPDCKGGSITSPISGPTAIVLTVAAGGAVYDGTGPIAQPCDCGEHREGAPGAVCQRCARAIRDA